MATDPYQRIAPNFYVFEYPMYQILVCLYVIIVVYISNDIKISSGEKFEIDIKVCLKSKFSILADSYETVDNMIFYIT